MSDVSNDSLEDPDADSAEKQDDDAEARSEDNKTPKEIGGRDGPDPARYGDWERNGRCVDF